MSIVTDVYDAADRHDWQPHSHVEHMLVWPERGSVEADVDGRSWLVPPGLGLWVPGGTTHAVRAKASVRFNCSYFDSEAAIAVSGGVTLMSVSPAAMALMSHVTTQQMEADARALGLCFRRGCWSTCA